jgi:hypothetical protein
MGIFFIELCLCKWHVFFQGGGLGFGGSFGFGGNGVGLVSMIKGTAISIGSA